MITTFYHNPRCSKSCQSLQILSDANIDITVVEYLKTPPTVAELTSILQKLAMLPEDLIRKNEVAYKASGLDNPDLSSQQQIKLMVANPIVIERPILVTADKAIIGRPPENIISIV